MCVQLGAERQECFLSWCEIFSVLVSDFFVERFLMYIQENSYHSIHTSV